MGTLRRQLQDLKVDIERLTIEKENLARYSPVPTSQDVLRYDPSEKPYIDVVDARLAEQQANFDGIARRARERLVEQERSIEELRKELSRAEESLQSMHMAQEEDVFSARLDPRQVSMADRAALGVGIFDLSSFNSQKGTLTLNFAGGYIEATISICRFACRF